MVISYNASFAKAWLLAEGGKKKEKKTTKKAIYQIKPNKPDNLMGIVSDVSTKYYMKIYRVACHCPKFRQPALILELHELNTNFADAVCMLRK